VNEGNIQITFDPEGDKDFLGVFDAIAEKSQGVYDKLKDIVSTISQAIIDAIKKVMGFGAEAAERPVGQKPGPEPNVAIGFYAALKEQFATGQAAPIAVIAKSITGGLVSGLEVVQAAVMGYDATTKKASESIAEYAANLLGKIAGAAGSAGAGVLPLTGALSSVGKSAGSAALLTVGLPGVIVSSVQSMFSGISDIVSKAAPATAAKFEIAMGSLSATFGQALAPIMEVATGLIERLADIMAGLDLEGLFSPLADILGALGDAFLSIMEALGPVINMLISVLVPVLKTVADVIKSVGDFVAKVIYFIQRLVWTMVQWMDDFVHNWKQRLTLGLAEGEMRTRTVSDIWDQSGKWLEEQKKRIQMDSHRTPGPRSVDIITNIEQISARAQEAAGKIDAARQTADNTKQMVGSLSWIGRMVEEVARRHGMDLDGVAAQQAQDRAGRGHAFAERVFDRNIADQLRAQGLIR
jgi:hypothetical protein